MPQFDKYRIINTNSTPPKLCNYSFVHQHRILQDKLGKSSETLQNFDLNIALKIQWNRPIC